MSKKLKDKQLKQEIKGKIRAILPRLEGKQANWYKDANLYAKSLAIEFSLPLVVTSAIIAVLSPRNRWERNKADAYNIIKHKSFDVKVCTFNKNKEKALKLLECKNETDIMKILSGRKVISFYNNILLRNSHVTIDSWMYRIADVKASPKNYIIIEDVINEIALRHGIHGFELQELLWLEVRGE